MPGTSRSHPDRRRSKRASLGLLGAALLLLLPAVAVLVHAYTLPVESVGQDAWYSYQQELRFNFTASVATGTVYATPVQRPEDLVRSRLPVEPPQFRRVLVAKLVDHLDLSMPYTFRADRPAELKGSYRLEGRLVTPLWQRPYPLGPPESVAVTGTELTLGQAPLYLPVRELIDDIQGVIKELGLGQEMVELHIRPVAQVEAAGLPQPVTTGLAPEFTVVIRGPNIVVEVDEPRVVRDEQALTSSTVTAISTRILGRELPVGWLRQVSAAAVAVLALCLLLYWAVGWLQRERQSAALLEHLGPALVNARAFEPSPGLVLVEIDTARDLVALHLQSHRPVVRVGNTYHLVDGSTYYRLILPTDAQKE